jgi:hypothetical protein
MKKISRSPSNDIKFDNNVTYNDNFADWLTEMVDHWAKNYTGCTFEIRQVGTEGTQVEIESKPKQNINFDCSNSLNTDLSKVNKIKYEKKASETKTYYIVTWKTESKETPKKDSSKSKTGTTDNEQDSEIPSSLKQLVAPLANKVATSIRSATNITNEEKEINKKLLEEIDRIKELLK